jgi:hypothetical protein
MFDTAIFLNNETQGRYHIAYYYCFFVSRLSFVSIPSKNNETQGIYAKVPSYVAADFCSDICIHLAGSVYH